MTRPEFLQILEQYRNHAPTITGPGLATRQLFSIVGDDPSILYNMEMQYATPLCMGIALARPRQRVLALEGDGSLLSGIGVLTTVARYKPKNLTIVVLDNESYSTFGNAEMPSATADGLDLEAMARASGIEKTATVRTVQETKAVVPAALSEEGPWLVVAKVEAHGDVDPAFARNAPDVLDQAFAFYAFLQKSGRQ